MEQETNIIDKKIIIAIVVFTLLFIVGIFVLSFVRKPKTGSVSTQTSSIPQATQQKAVPTIIIPTSSSTITLTSNGFEPQTITIKPKTQVVWTNKSGNDASVNSADHPTHQLYSPLNLGLFSNGTSVSLNFNTPGTYRYHDHLHPQKTGTIVVE